MKENDLVSIIIPAYNCGLYINQCIGSVLCQSYDNIEIVVIYRESADDTYDQLTKFDGKIRILEQGQGVGPAHARNIGIISSSGRYLCFCDSDDYLHTDKIRRQLDFFNEHKECGLIYSDFSLTDSDNNFIEQVTVPEWNFSNWIRSDGFIGLSTIMVKRQCVIKAGSFNESLKSNEDFDLLMRLSGITSFRKCQGDFTFRRIHKDNLSKNIQATLCVRSKIYYDHGYLLLAITSFIKGLIYSHLFYYGIEHPKFWNRTKPIRNLIKKITNQ